MERNKMEEEFKLKLNQREIVPSDHAWDRLDAMLNEAEDKEEKKVIPMRSVKWLYIAASFVGLALIGTVFFKDGKTPDTKTSVAIENVKGNNARENQPANPTVKAISPVIESNSNDNQQVKQTQVAGSEAKTQHPGQAQKQIEKTGLPLNQDNQVAQAKAQNPEPNTLNPTPNTVSPIPNTQMKATVDQQIVSIDAKFLTPKAIKVDASSLLSQVDGELELSFREKVIKTVGKKYQNVKVALANRNQE